MRASVPAALAASVPFLAILAAAAPAADRSAKPRLAVLELAAPGGSPAAGRDGHGEEIDVFSVTWGTARPQHDALTDGLLIVRYNQDGTQAVPAALSRTSKVEALGIKQKMVEEEAHQRQKEIGTVPSTGAAPAPRANDRLRNAGPKDGWKAAPGGANETLTVGGGRTEGAVAGNTKWKNIVLKRGVETSAAGGVRVAVGDVDGDGSASAASGQATGKRVHMPIRVRTYDAPLPSGSVLLRLASPWPGCRAGDRFNGGYLVVGTTHRYRLGGASVAGCSDDAVAINYRSIIAQQGTAN